MKTLVEGARGCGFRSPGGLYLVAPALGEDCSRLPLPVESCPTCGAGVKPARGWTWIVPVELVGFEIHSPSRHSWRCPIGMPGMDPGHDGVRAGLLWIGESFYPTPTDFIEEAVRMGVSRRISTVPKGFVVGETYVFMGHRKGKWTTPKMGQGVQFVPAIVTIFRPTAIEYVVRGDETEAELEALEKRGIEPVRVVPENEQASLALEAAARLGSPTDEAIRAVRVGDGRRAVGDYSSTCSKEDRTVEQGIIEVDGKRMKRCPGWDGNSFRCGRGSPRLIAETAEVCENCSRGMRKRGQQTREEEERELAERKKREREAERGAKILLERAGVKLTAAERKKFAALLSARNALVRADVEGGARQSWYGTSELYEPTREDVLLVAVGLPVPEEKRYGRRRR